MTRSDTRIGAWLLPGQIRSLALLATAQFVIAFDFTAVLIVLPQVGRDLHTAPTDLQWLVTAYAVALGGLLLLTGRLVDQRGRRRLFVAGQVVMAAGCGLALVATSVWLLVAARVLVGIGAALVSPATIALLNATFTVEAARNRALGIWGAAGAAGAVLGLVVGGLIANDLGWRAVFIVTGALCVTSAALGPWWLAPDGPAHGRPAARDLVDGALAVAGVVCLIWGLTDGAADPARPWPPLALVCGGIALCAVSVRRQATRSDPLLPLWLFRTQSFRLAAVVAFLFHMSLNNQVYAMTLRLQGTFGFSPLTAGFLLVPNELAIVIGAHAGGGVVNRYGVRGPLALAMLSGALGVLLYSLYWRSTPGVIILGAGLVISGLGQGVAWTAFWSSATRDVEPARHGMASGLVSMTAQFGQALGVAALTVVALVTARFTADVDVGLRVGQYVIVALAALATVAVLVDVRAANRSS